MNLKEVHIKGIHKNTGKVVFMVFVTASEDAKQRVLLEHDLSGVDITNIDIHQTNDTSRCVFSSFATDPNDMVGG